MLCKGTGGLFPLTEDSSASMTVTPAMCASAVTPAVLCVVMMVPRSAMKAERWAAVWLNLSAVEIRRTRWAEAKA